MTMCPDFLHRASQVGSPDKSATNTLERKSRIRGPQMERESGDGMDAAELAASEHQLSFSNLGMPKADNLQSFYDSESKESVETQSETEL